MDNIKRWYVLYVQSGKERELADRIEQLGGIETLVPTESRLIRQRGIWRQRDYTLFAGYIFVRLVYNWMAYYRITCIDGHIRILGGGHDPTPVPLEEMARVTDLSQLATEPSVVQFDDDGTYEIISGTLLELRNNIIKIKRRQKRAVVRIPFRWGSKDITLSFVEPHDQTLHNAGS